MTTLTTYRLTLTDSPWEKDMHEIQTWPGWQMVAPLGEGSFGKVYEIEHTDYGETYRAALKVITIPSREVNAESIFLTKQSGVDTESYYENYVADIMKEVAVMSKFVGNSNIVSYQGHMVLHDPGTMRWDILLRMELLTPLTKYVSVNGFSDAKLVQMGIGLCRALELCEQHGIIHRDIKLANIFVSDNGDFKLGDFGIARSMGSADLTMSRKGTLGYMAPEVYRNGRYGHKADIYSLGMVMYTILNNWRPPFLPEGEYTDTDRENAAIKRLTARQLPPPATGDPVLQDIIMKALSYDPEMRFSHASEMRAALEKYQSGIRMVEYDNTVLLENLQSQRTSGLKKIIDRYYAGLGGNFVLAGLLPAAAAVFCLTNAACYLTGAAWKIHGIQTGLLYKSFPALRNLTMGIGIGYLLCMLLAVSAFLDGIREKSHGSGKMEILLPLLLIIDFLFYMNAGRITGLGLLNYTRTVTTAIVTAGVCILYVFYYRKHRSRL